MVSSSGRHLLPEDAVHALSERLLSLTTIFTLNIFEEVLLVRGPGHELELPDTLEDVKDLALQVQKLGCDAVLLRDGHAPMSSRYKPAKEGETAALTIDILYAAGDFTVFESAYVKSKSPSGRGCSLASAVTAFIALEKPLPIAVRDACRYVETAIQSSFELSKGNGTINHFHTLQVLPFAPGYFVEYRLGRPSIQPLWKAFTEHKSVRGIGDETLPLDVFKMFLVQDYLCLTQFARTNALAAYKSNNMDDISASARIVLGAQKEMELHLEYCQGFGFSKED